MSDHLFFLTYWLLDSLLLYILGLLFPSYIVLGNYRLLPVEACIYAGFWLTFFVWTMWDFMTKSQAWLMLLRKVKLEPTLLEFSFFFFVNSLGVWLISRYAVYTGLGITSFWWAFLLGAVSTAAQRISWRQVGKRKKAKAS